MLNYSAINVTSIHKDQSLLLMKTESHFQTYEYKWSWSKQKFGHECQQDSKPGITALAKASNKLLFACLCKEADT
jgi:hypothetical protein